MVRPTQEISEAELIICEAMRPAEIKLKEKGKKSRKKSNFVMIYNTKHIIMSRIKPLGWTSLLLHSV